MVVVCLSNQLWTWLYVHIYASIIYRLTYKYTIQSSQYISGILNPANSFIRRQLQSSPHKFANNSATITPLILSFSFLPACLRLVNICYIFVRTTLFFICSFLREISCPLCVKPSAENLCASFSTFGGQSNCQVLLSLACLINRNVHFIRWPTKRSKFPRVSPESLQTLILSWLSQNSLHHLNTRTECCWTDSSSGWYKHVQTWYCF